GLAQEALEQLVLAALAGAIAELEADDLLDVEDALDAVEVALVDRQAAVAGRVGDPLDLVDLPLEVDADDPIERDHDVADDLLLEAKHLLEQLGLLGRDRAL